MNKYFPHFISLLAFILICGYISFNESYKVTKQSKPTGFTPNNASEAQISAYRNAVSLTLPQELTFAGERVPLEVPDVRERLDRELHVNTYWHSSTIILLKKANKWLPRISEVLKSKGVPDDFKYLAAIEGGFINAVSPANAVGFWQIRKAAGKENGLEINKIVDERYDPIKSTEAACSYLLKAYKRFGNWTNVAASYNRGMSGFDRALKSQEVKSYYDLLLNEETSRYVFRILAIKEIFENPDKYGFDIDKEHLYQEEELKYVDVEKDILDLVEFSKQQGINYKLLKRHNPWLRDDYLKVSRNKVYKIAIPVDS